MRAYPPQRRGRWLFARNALEPAGEDDGLDVAAEVLEVAQDLGFGEASFAEGEHRPEGEVVRAQDGDVVESPVDLVELGGAKMPW